MITKAVAPGSPVANGLSEKAAQELGLNCGTRVGTSMIIVIKIINISNMIIFVIMIINISIMIIVMMITNINISNMITFRWGRV